MNKIVPKRFLKAVFPVCLRHFLRALLHYAQRVGRWGIILWQVRGITIHDQLILFLSALASPFLSFKSLLEWQDPILLENIQVDVRGVGKFSIRARCDDLWHVLPWREQAIFNMLRDKLRPGDIFIDAGANIGVYSVLAASLVGDQGKVVAVEMIPDTADRLESNLALNGISNVTVFRKALSDAGGEIVTAHVTPERYGLASISESQANVQTVPIEVKTMTLDDLVQDYDSARLMKIDIEGAEATALSGAEKLLAKIDFIVYESWGHLRMQNSPVDKLLRQAGFVLSVIDGNNRLAHRV